MVEDVMIPGQLWDRNFRFLKLRPRGKEPTYDMTNWGNDNYEFNDTDLLNHLIKGGNYAIIGGFGNLIMIDSDSQNITNISESMPETLTIKTGSPEEYKKHYFFITDEPMKGIRLSEEHLGDLGDVRGIGQYVVAPGSIHPKGDQYKVIKDVPIAKITSQYVRGMFKEYIDKNDSTSVGNFEPELKLRNSKFIKMCNVPDYCMTNKLKGETSKNWKLFPYIVDILHNRQSTIEPYKKIIEAQDHKPGAIKGWMKLAREGKLAKSSCPKMLNYLNRFHKDEVENICGKCPLFQNYKKKQEIITNKDYTELQKEVLISLSLKDRSKATELIVEEILKDNYIYTTRDDKASEVWIYKEGVYIPQGKSFIKELCRKILEGAYTSHLAHEVISKIETDTFIDHDLFFEPTFTYEVPVLNGILNIRTRELKEFDPKKVFFNKLPIYYNPASECPDIIDHLKTVLKSEEEVKVLLELFGFLLLKEYRIEKAFMFIGYGRNGKSKTIELMKKFVGPENTSSLPLRALHEESFSLSELFGRMANLASDLSKTDLKETGIIKSLIGRDTIQAKRKFLRDLNFVNYAKMIFAANELPRIYDTTDGFWTKWILIEFPYKFVNEKQYAELLDEEKENHRILDPDIITKLSTEEELSGLLNYALDGLDRVIEQKDFSYSKNTSEVKDLWIRRSDSFTAFCYDHIEEKLDGIVSKNELKRKYFLYRKKHKNLPGTSDKAINITLDNVFGVTDFQGPYDEKGERERFWKGITLRNIDKLNYEQDEHLI